MTPAELKKELSTRGFLVYRTLPDGVALAEYQRANLLVDAGIRICTLPTFGVLIRFRVEQHAYPGESDAQLYARARELAQRSGLPNLTEVRAECIPQTSPSDPSRVMDVFYEVNFMLAANDLEEAIAQASLSAKALRSLGS